jgi:hypothetical protein
MNKEMEKKREKDRKEREIKQKQ